MRSDLPEPENPVQPLRVIEQRNDHAAEAREAGIEDLVEFRAVYTREVLLHVALAGPEDGEPVILLHGFPDFWLSWAAQVRPLVKKGYRLIMPDLRGYNMSEKPREVDAYRLDRLGPDVLDILEAFELEQAHLVGHDWGGALAWWLAEHHPESFETLTILNCPPADVMEKTLKSRPRQLMRSWYIGFFQIPRVPEIVLGRADCAALVRGLRKLSTPSAFTGGEIKIYRKAWGRPGALRSMINWYRAARGSILEDRPPSKQITIPTTIIWGKQDLALDEILVEPSAARCEDVEVHWVEHAGHWVQREAPKFVTEKLVDGFQRAKLSD